jgi:hypothetical protein
VVRLAWGIGLCSLGLVVATMVLLALDWSALIGPITSQVPWFLNAIIVGALGVLIATRRPRNSIGWLMLTIGFSNALSLLATYLAARDLFSGTSPGSWVEWPVWLENWLGLASALLILFLIFLFPTGRLPGPTLAVGGVGHRCARSTGGGRIHGHNGHDATLLGLAKGT